MKIEKKKMGKERKKKKHFQNEQIFQLKKNEGKNEKKGD